MGYMSARDIMAIKFSIIPFHLYDDELNLNATAFYPSEIDIIYFTYHVAR